MLWTCVCRSDDFYLAAFCKVSCIFSYYEDTVPKTGFFFLFFFLDHTQIFLAKFCSVYYVYYAEVMHDAWIGLLAQYFTLNHYVSVLIYDFWPQLKGILYPCTVLSWTVWTNGVKQESRNTTWKTQTHPVLQSCRTQVPLFCSLLCFYIQIVFNAPYCYKCDWNALEVFSPQRLECTDVHQANHCTYIFIFML